MKRQGGMIIQSLRVEACIIKQIYNHFLWNERNLPSLIHAAAFSMSNLYFLGIKVVGTAGTSEGLELILKNGAVAAVNHR